MKIGVLLTNLGTPDSYSVGDVRRFLGEFLWDRRVVEAPRWLWWLVLNLVILRIRPRKTAAAYRKIWRDDGSPLLVISRRQQAGLARLLQHNLAANSPPVSVELAMRYGTPSIANGIEKLHDDGAHKIIILPLYPQYCAATTAATFDAVGAALSRRRWIPALRLVADYHDNAGYISALATSVREHVNAHDNDDSFLLMSFHGMPQKYADAGDPYPAQCFATAKLLAAALGLDDDAWRVSFQSRVGPEAWLRPYTDDTLRELAAKNVRRVRVICPGFSADCLETLEEIEMENRDLFLRAGGEQFDYIPCLNDNDAHLNALAKIITDTCNDWLAKK